MIAVILQIAHWSSEFVGVKTMNYNINNIKHHDISSRHLNFNHLYRDHYLQRLYFPFKCK